MSDQSHPFAPLCEAWRKLISSAKKQKQTRFGQYADEIYRFYNGNHNWMWQKEYARESGGYLNEDSQSPLPEFQIQINKISDAVDLYGPALIHQYPQLLVSCVEQPDISPEALGMSPFDPSSMQQYEMLQLQRQSQQNVKDSISAVKQHYLNWVQVEGGKKPMARRGITEAIVKGMGVGLTEIYTPRGSDISYPRSRHISCDQLIKDPDAKRPEDVQWIAIEWYHPVNRVEEKFGHRPGSLKGVLQSKASQSTKQGRNDAKSNKDKSATSYDMVRYWEVYSKNGFGHRLRNAKDVPEKVKRLIAEWGDFTYGVYAENVPYPLNIPTELLPHLGADDLADRAQWPIPFWRDDSGGHDWPVSELSFKEDPNDIWPIGLFKPVIGEIRFVNWCMSFLADKAAKDAVDYLGVLEAAAEEIQEQLNSQRGPTRMLKIGATHGEKISDIVSFLQRPQSNISDLWTMVAEVMTEIDKRTGLTELVYGMTSRSMRSATEADIVGEHTSIRPDDMSQKCDDWYSLMAMKEMQAAAWSLEREDYEPVLGPVGAYVFEQHVQTQDYDAIARDYSYRVAAGSARKPNKAQKLRSLNEFGQVFLPVATEFVGMGIVEPVNAYLKEYADAMDLDADEFLIELPEADEDQGPSPEEVEAQSKIAELEMKLQEHELKLDMDEEKHDQDMRQDRERHALDVSTRRKMVSANGNGRR